nr:MAG TPA: Soluble cytochrome cA c5, Protein stability, Shewanella [Caudoviricetes sp.]
MVEYYCQKCHFVNNRSVLFFNYCQKRCFVKIKTVKLLTDSFVNY